VYTWSGAGSDNLWTDPTNWGSTTFPGTASTDVATFGSAGSSNQPTLNSNESIGELIFSIASGGWTISDSNGSVLTINATGTTAGLGINDSAQTSGTNTINANITASATQTWEVGVGGTLVINGTVTQTAGTLTLGTAALTGTMNLTGADSFGAVTITGAKANLSGADSFSGAFSVTAGTATLSGTDGFSSTTTFSGGTATLSGNDTFAGAFKASGATVNLSGNNSYGSNLTVTAGTLNLTGNNPENGGFVIQVGGIINVSGANGTLPAQYGMYLEAATLNIDNTAAAANNRLGASPITLQGNETITLKGNSTTATTESIGSLTIAEASTAANITAFGAYPGYGIPVLTATNGNTTASNTTLTIGSLGWSDGNSPLLVNGVNLGAANGAQIVISNPPPLSGSSTTPGTQNQQIVPFLIGEAASGFGTATGSPNTFVTYGSTGALRPLDPSTEFTNNNIVGGNNTYITAATTAGASTAINSLVINGNNLTIADGQTLTNSSGSLLFVAGATPYGIQPSSPTTANPGGYAFSSSAVVTVTGNPTVSATSPNFVGAINVPISGSSALTDAGKGILQLGAQSPNFSGDIWVNGIVQLGNGTSASSDGGIPSVSNIYLNFGNGPLAYSEVGTLVVNNINPTNLSNTQIIFPFSGNGYIYTEGPSNITFGNLEMNSPANGAPYMFMYGTTVNGTYQGSVTFNGSITQPNATAIGSEYFYDAALTTTINGQFVTGYPKFYMQAVPVANLFGPTASSITGMTLTLSANGQVGNGFNGSGATATPNANSAITGFIFTDMNRAQTSAVPPTVTFYQNGTINAGSGVVYDGYYTGNSLWYVNNSLAAGTSLEIAYGVTGDGTAGSVGAMYVAPNQLVAIAPLASDSQTGAFVVGYGNATANVASNMGYMNIGSGSIVTDSGTTNSAYIGIGSNGQIDMPNNSAGAGSELNIYYKLYMNSGTAGYVGVQDVLNVGANNVVNFGNGSGGGGNGGTTVSMNALSTSSLAGTAILNVLGGTVNVVNSTTTNSNVAINLFGTGSNDNVIQTSLSTGVVNVGGANNPSIGGLLRTGYLRAETISATISGTTYYGDASNYANFNGGELDYNGTIATVQGTFLQYGLAAAIVNSGGATIGSTFTGSGFNSNAIAATVPLLAPPGNGITKITVSSPGTGYVAPPEVEISDSQGFDGTAYAVIDSNPTSPTYGQVTSIVVTSPGFNMSNPTVTLVGGGGSGATATPTILANSAYLNSSNFSTTSQGGLIKSQSGELELVGTYSGTNSTKTAAYSFTTSTGATIGGVASAGAPTGANLGNDPAVGSGNAANYIRNTTSTYVGPTVIQSGTLGLITATSASVTGATGTVTTFPATNNNIPYSSMIVVGDTPADSGAVLQVFGSTGAASGGSTSGIGATGGFELAPALRTASGQQIGQILAGFGKVSGSSSVGLTVGLATTGNNFGQATTYSGSNNSMISPGYTPNVGTTAGGTPMGQTWQGYAFNTAQGAAAGATTPVTGALTITGSANASSMPTTLGAGGGYYWKVNLSTGGTGATSTPGTATTSDLTGTNWDALVLDTVAVTATPGSPFTVQAVGFGSPTSVTIGGSNTQSYSWTIASATDASLSANLLANFSLNTSGMPAPATGYGYFLSAQAISGDSDLVVNYAPVPEPTALALLAPAAAAMLLRRRRAAAARSA